MEKRRRFILQASALVALSSRWRVVGAERYPSRPVRIIVPSVAGGSLDSTTRRIAQPLAKALGRPVIVDNRPGASATMGAGVVAQAAPDGYTLLAGSNTSMSVAPVLMPKLAYHSLQSFEPITQYGHYPAVLVIHPTLGVRSVHDLVALAKAKPGKLATRRTVWLRCCT